FWELFNQIGINSDLDLYQGFVAILVSKFSSDYRIFFSVLAVVYGFFYSRNIFLIVNLTKSKSIKLAILFFAIIFLKGIWFIEGARFWTSAQIFIFFIVSYCFYNKKYYYLLL